VFWKRKKSKLPEPQGEPLFSSVRGDDLEMRRAYASAAASLGEFQAHIHRPGQHICAAKLRLRDPDLSQRLGEDRFVYLWLAGVGHDVAANTYTAAFFEVPKELSSWYQRGQRLQFKGEDIFDWFVNDEGLLYGGFTMRVARSRLPEAERSNFDSYTGVKQWVRLERN
jgi:uncharacterized protein YegJ (DUF2314 family)